MSTPTPVSYGQMRPNPVQPQMQPRNPVSVDRQSVATLQSMGFDSKLSNEALLLNPSLQRAIQWLSTNPIPLSSAWDVRKDPKSNRVYYANKENKQTYWERPIVPAQWENGLKSLLGMGFPRRVCTEALAHYKGNVQSATNWILYNRPQPMPALFRLLVENGKLIYQNTQTGQRTDNRPVQPTF